MTQKSIIIIGAGLAGLSTGCYARMNGYKAHIFELHNQPGGVCTDWKRKGYTFDGCIHFLMGCQPGASVYRLYQELGLLKANELKPRLGFNSFYDEGSGKKLVVTNNLDQLATDMKTLAPGDEKIIDEFIAGCKAMETLDMGLSKPRELMGMIDHIRFFWSLRGHMKFFGQYNIPVADFAQKIQDPFIRNCIMYLFLPEMPLVLLFMFLGQLSAGQLGYIEGGSLKFSQAIAERYKELGGEVTYGAEVVEIIMENDRAAGVQLADGTEHRADLVVSAADGHSTIFKMLHGRYVDQGIRDRYEQWPLFSPIMTISYGVTGKLPGQPHTQTVFFKEPVKASVDNVPALMFRIFDYDPSLAPEGNTVVQVIYPTGYDYWMNLQPDRPRYEAEKSEAAKAVLAKLDSVLPGIASRVEVTDVATPYTYWRYTRNYRGAFEGWLMTPETLRANIPKTLPGLSNFYMAGQWVEPGGGILSALLSGRGVIQIICSRDGNRFVTI